MFLSMFLVLTYTSRLLTENIVIWVLQRVNVYSSNYKKAKYMKQFYTILILVLPVLITIPGCFDAPEKFVAPVWDVNFNLPLINKDYTLQTIIENDTEFIKSYPPGSMRENLLYYSTFKPIEPINIGDKLKFENSVESSYSQILGNIEVKDLTTNNTSLGFDWVPLITPGTTELFPATSNAFTSIILPKESQFSWIKVSSGAIKISIKNNLPSPLDLTMRNIVLSNAATQENVADYGSPVFIPAGQTVSVTVTLKTNIPISNQLRFSADLSNPGSGTTKVLIPSSATDFAISFVNPVITEANAILKGNTMNLSNQIKLDDSTMITKVQIDKGSLNINLRNNIDVGITARIKVNELYSNYQSTDPYEFEIKVNRRGSNTIQQNLSGFTMKTNGNYSGTLHYSVNVLTDATTDSRIVKNSDDVSGSISVSPLTLNSFEGIIKPTHLDVKTSSIKIDLGSLKDKFKFGKLNFSAATMNLYVKSSAQMSMNLDGRLSAPGFSNALDFSALIDNNNQRIDIPSSKISNFLSGFSSTFPSELNISGEAVINKSYQNSLFSINKSDSVYGSAQINIPFNVGIDNGVFSDTMDVNLEDLKEELTKIQSVIISFEVSNGLAAKLNFTGFMTDITKANKLLDFPPNRQADKQFIEIPAAQVNSEGKVIAPAVKTETIELFADDVTRLINCKFLMSKITINTSNGSSVPVEFKTTDAIKVRSSCKVVYRVKN